MNVKNLPNNKGAALITSLILLMALTMVSLSAVKSTSVQVLISGNDENTLQSRQYAQSVVDTVMQNDTNNFVIGAKDGYTDCAVQNSANSCDQTGLPITGTMFSNIGISTTNGVQAEVKFLRNGTAPRLNASQASSATAFHGAYVAVTGSYNVPPNSNNGNPDGKASVVQGYVMILPNAQ